MHEFILTFIPLFVAVDPVGVLPVYLGLASPLSEIERRAIVFEATLTAGAIGAGFLVVGQTVLQVLGVTVDDVQVAGGILLLVLSVYDVLHPELPLRRPGSRVGVVPLGTPLIVGPAVLTTLLVLAGSRGYWMTLVSFALNLLIVWTTLRWGSFLQQLITEAGSRAVAKVLNLLLAAIGVHMIRVGFEGSLPHVGR